MAENLHIDTDWPPWLPPAKLTASRCLKKGCARFLAMRGNATRPPQWLLPLRKIPRKPGVRGCSAE
jgi:hypothetical protein